MNKSFKDFYLSDRELMVRIGCCNDNTDENDDDGENSIELSLSYKSIKERS